MKYLNKFIDKYGWSKLLRLAVYPLTLLVWLPVRFYQTICEAKILTNGKWTDYIGFDVKRGINSLYYWNDALNLNRFGRSGISKYKGLGNADLTKLFKYSLPSLYAYWIFGAVLPIICMLVWWGGYLLWFDSIDITWGAVVLVLGIFSTISFAATFSFQNYNVLGWMFFPIGLWAMFNDQFAVAILAWMLASFGSITVVAIAAMLTFVYSIEIYSFVPFLCVLPAILKVLTHFAHKSSDTGLVENILLRAKAIGVTSKGVKYRRITSKRLSIINIYFIVIYLVFAVSIYFGMEMFSLVWIGAIGIYIANILVVRFADDQSMHMMMLGLSVSILLQANEYALLIPYWLVISPLPLLLLITTDNSSPDMPPLLSPFNIRELLDSVGEFLAPVKKDQRVLMAFNDPGNVYENVFDGYRRILEVPLYVASERQFHFFPDWWAVFDCNYIGAPDFWGRTVEEVNKNIKTWNCDFVVIYQESGTEIDKMWENSGFKVLKEFDWAEQEHILRQEKPWSGFAPKWWLLKIPT